MKSQQAHCSLTGSRLHSTDLRLRTLPGAWRAPITTSSELIGRFHWRDGSRPISGFLFLAAFITVRNDRRTRVFSARRAPSCTFVRGCSPSVRGGVGTEGPPGKGTGEGAVRALAEHGPDNAMGSPLRSPRRRGSDARCSAGRVRPSKSSPGAPAPAEGGFLPCGAAACRVASSRRAMPKPREVPDAAPSRGHGRQQVALSPAARAPATQATPRFIIRLRIDERQSEDCGGVPLPFPHTCLLGSFRI